MTLLRRLVIAFLAGLNGMAAGLPATASEAIATHLDRIIERGVLRVGTTGDYAPFSLALPTPTDAGPAFTGFDIEMARSLATSLGVRAEFVQTSWPTLMADLAADRFDIGMSGISRNLRRARQSWFSRPYHRGGKTPIARCADAAKFRSLADIDRPGVRVVVNPGGTNEIFAKSRLEHAPVRVHPDNRTIFEEIVEHRADVMFTDAIEVALQSIRHPTLCPALHGTLLTQAEKAYLLPRDADLKHYVDLWLERIDAEEAMDRRLQRYLGDHTE